MRIRRILVPVDFSAASRRALEYAVEFGRSFGAEMTVLFVVEPTSYAAPGDMYALSSAVAMLFEEQCQRGRERLRDLKREIEARGVRVRTLLEAGVPYQVIVERARKQPADLIVMATHGRTGLSHLLLGSVAEKVVRTAGCPVLTVRGDGPSGSPARSAPRQPRRSGQRRRRSVRASARARRPAR